MKITLNRENTTRVVSFAKNWIFILWLVPAVGVSVGITYDTWRAIGTSMHRDINIEQIHKEINKPENLN